MNKSEYYICLNEQTLFKYVNVSKKKKKKNSRLNVFTEICLCVIFYLLVVNVWSHQSALQRYAFKSSAVRPTITTGGATIVRTNKPIPTQRQIMPNRFSNVASVIFTALADRTLNTTEILFKKKNTDLSIKVEC